MKFSLKKKPLNKEEALKKLGVESFEELPEGKVKKFIKLLPKMDPEVAKAALAQVPEFAKTAREVIVSFKEVTLKGLQINADNSKSFNESCDTIINALTEELKNENLTQEQKNEIANQIIELLKLKDKRHKEDKEYVMNIVKTVGDVAVKVLGIVAVVIIAVGSATDNDNKE